MAPLEGKVAIITGASSGIGRAAAKLFAREGAKLIVTARRQNLLDALTAEIDRAGGHAVAVAGDIRDEALAERLVATAVQSFGGLDIAFNNAGIVGASKPVPELALADWHETIEVNLTAAFLCARHQIPAMVARGGGALIFTSSFVGHTVGFPNMGAYAAAKAGMIGLMKVIAAEFGPKGVRANALLPGGTDTEMNIARSPDAPPETQAFIENLHALKRMASPEEIATAALFLASDASRFVTGTALLADGGVSINRT